MTTPQAAAPAAHRSPRLTVVLPARSTAERPVEQRLAHLAFDRSVPQEVEFLCVDEGSEGASALALEAACRTAGAGYLRLPPTGEAFSIARARNFGALAARGDYLLFQDLDLVPHDGFYARLLHEIEFQGLAARRDEFLVVPVGYLTEAATASLLRHGRLDPQPVLDAIVTGDARLLESYAPVSSCVVLHRARYLALGGQRADFVGWGYEDWEFAYRLMRRARRFPAPPDFHRETYGPFAKESGYIGWRAAFQLYGDTSLRRGLFLTHAHHPSEGNRRGAAEREANRARLGTALAAVRAGREPRFDLLGHVRQIASADRPPLEVTLVVAASPLGRSRALQSALHNPLPIERLAALEDSLSDPLAALAAAGLKLVGAVVEDPHLDRRRALLFQQLRREVPTFSLARLGLSDCFFLEDDDTHCCAGSLTAWNEELPPDADRLGRLRRYLARELPPPGADRATASSADADRGGLAPAARRAALPRKALQLGLFMSAPTLFRFEGEELVDEAALDLLARVEARLAVLPPGIFRLVIHCPRHMVRRFTGSGHEIRALQDLDAAIAEADLCIFQHDGLALRGLLHGKPCFLPSASAFVARGLARPIEALEAPAAEVADAGLVTRSRLMSLLCFLVLDRASRLALRADPAAARRRRPRLQLDVRMIRLPDGSAVRFSRHRPTASARLLAQLHQAISLERIERRPEPRLHDRPLALRLLAGGRPAERRALQGEPWEDPEDEEERPLRRDAASGAPADGSAHPADTAKAAPGASRRRRPRFLRLMIKLVRRPDLYLLDSRIPWLRRLGHRLVRDRL